MDLDLYAVELFLMLLAIVRCSKKSIEKKSHLDIFVLHFSPNSRGIACWVAELNFASSNYKNVNMKYFISWLEIEPITCAPAPWQIFNLEQIYIINIWLKLSNSRAYS